MLVSRAPLSSGRQADPLAVAPHLIDSARLSSRPFLPALLRRAMSTAPSVGASLTTPRVPAGSVSEFDELDLLSEGIASIQSAQNDGGHYLVKLHGGTKVVRVRDTRPVCPCSSD